MDYSDTLVILPTYNEAANIVPLIKAIRAALPGATVLVVDDDSPDGTTVLVRQQYGADDRVRALIRTSDRGRGRAGIAGFRWAVEHGAQFVVEMDADFSHQPRFLPSLVAPARAGSLDVVIGSRQIAGGSELGRSVWRRTITKLANAYVRALLGVRVRDCTSGFRCFRSEALQAIPWGALTSVGPSLVEEVLHLAALLEFRIGEVPITFAERRAGESQLTIRKLLDTAWLVLVFRFQARRKLASVATDREVREVVRP